MEHKNSLKYFSNRKRLFTLKFVLLAILLVTVSNFMFSVCFPKLTPIITIKDGKVQGKMGYSRSGREYWQFLSIPYAQPPINNLKFQPPVPVKPWVGVKMTTKNPPLCVQFISTITQTVHGELDCLYLNVFTHPINKKNPKKLPVMIHIHGGGFLLSGSLFFGPEYLMDHDIVVVTFNYRLGPFGFLNFNHDPSSDGVLLPRGNMGLKDQLLVLKWVQNNIAQFSGDPDQVTLFGESAGSASAHLHVLSPKSRGLFHRAFSHSGTAFCNALFTSRPRELALNYAKQFGCPLNNSQALLNCLENFDPWEMVKFQKSSTDPAFPKDNLSPSIELVESDDRFLWEYPQDIIDGGKFQKVPYVHGVNNWEGTIRVSRFEAIPERFTMVQKNWTKHIGNVLLFDKLARSKAKAIRKFYFKTQEEMRNPEDFKKVLNLLVTDVLAFEPVHRAALGHANSGAETYLFYYNYTSRWLPSTYSMAISYRPNSWLHNYVQVFWNVFSVWVKEKLLGQKSCPFDAGHADDLPQVWNVLGSKYFSFSDLQFSQAYVEMIAKFVQGKKPLTFGSTEWPSVQENNNSTLKEDPILYMLIDNPEFGKVIPEPFTERINFWNSIGVKHLGRNYTVQDPKTINS